ncbi:MAG: hypothetical protein Q8S53_14510 [Brevundimonas sp.]|uniref:hypothetical protein n=1 Tax=Brevundimonas sp. TaxID=1871086 RepID=UPI0027362643|nr:hypothetical protein [Brevundimonas sp.]MDP3379574.1 hypothetical protein [Brevundimonas sp.]
MGIRAATIILLLELLAPPRFGWVDAGLEEQNRTAVRIDSVPTDTSQVFSATYVAVPPQPRGQRRYTLWLSRWDCEAGTRQRTARIDYSPHHDPRTTRLDEDAERATDNPAVARQLNILCNWRSPTNDDVMSIAAFVAAD